MLWFALLYRRVILVCAHTDALCCEYFVNNKVSAVRVPSSIVPGARMLQRQSTRQRQFLYTSSGSGRSGRACHHQ